MDVAPLLYLLISLAEICSSPLPYHYSKTDAPIKLHIAVEVFFFGLIDTAKELHSLNMDKDDEQA